MGHLLAELTRHVSPWRAGKALNTTRPPGAGQRAASSTTPRKLLSSDQPKF
ncbi:MAG: hypothetical protein JO045_19275 [Mycobacterium sp.]|nr:hypothetical protein [Mycobacterium sp.]